MLDQQARPLRDLRISVTDRCNFRCHYCMPADIFGLNYQFLPRHEILTFEEISRVVHLAISLGVRKVRLTGGEPLLRRGLADLVAMLSCIDGLDDLAITTNASLLAHRAESLALAGLHRVTVSLDALDPQIFAEMNGTGAKVERVLAGIGAARMHGLPVKVNAVIQRGKNESQILPLLHWGRERGITVRFIEFMDVGESNGWQKKQVVSAAEILQRVRTEFLIEQLPALYPGEVAQRWRFLDNAGEFGLIASVTQPFCGACNRLRLSAEGKLFTCLFAGEGRDLRARLRDGSSDNDICQFFGKTWQKRNDRFSELRGLVSGKKVEMSYLGG